MRSKHRFTYQDRARQCQTRKFFHPNLRNKRSYCPLQPLRDYFLAEESDGRVKPNLLNTLEDVPCQWCVAWTTVVSCLQSWLVRASKLHYVACCRLHGEIIRPWNQVGYGLFNYLTPATKHECFVVDRLNRVQAVRSQVLPFDNHFDPLHFLWELG